MAPRKRKRRAARKLNPAAKALRTPQFRSRLVLSKRRYSRKAAPEPEPEG
jgi:hypothetical protein